MRDQLFFGWRVVVFSSLLAFVSLANAQEATEQKSGPSANANLLQNPSFEEVEDGLPTGWGSYQTLKNAGYKFSLDESSSVDGKRSLMIDSSDGSRPFLAFNHPVFSGESLKPLRGKRVRFRAAVKTADRAAASKGQLWLRIDDKSGNTIAFDNMDDRPIVSDDWDHYQIVADVGENADVLMIGLLVIGKAKVWIDDASFEIIEKTDESELTAGKLPNIGESSASRKTDSAPTQPFYNHWLWLALFVMVLMVIGQFPNSHLQRFALRFSICYWIFYCFPSLILGLLTGLLTILSDLGSRFKQLDLERPTELLGTAIKKISDADHWLRDSVVLPVSERLFGFEEEIVSPWRNGSGDTTYAYINLFCCFCLAIICALLWTAILYWRSTEHKWIRDLQRSYLRYVLAITMLGYGLAKAGFIRTQFDYDGGGPADFQLNRTYGQSSPMGLVWTFMAASPAYTFFAGLGEVVGGFLLAFRRTATFGAFVTFGVMTNVVMLNFCYDVPVKQYSFHLLFMALVIAAPDIPRLFKVLFLNKSTQPCDHLDPPFENKLLVRGQAFAKGILVLWLILAPIGLHIEREVKHEHVEREKSPHLLMNRGFRWVNEYPFNR